MTITNIHLSADEYAAITTLDALELHKRRYPYVPDGNAAAVVLSHIAGGPAVVFVACAGEAVWMPQ
jgi:hypothetical protein